jgi:hypothetical protein
MFGTLRSSLPVTRNSYWYPSYFRIEWLSMITICSDPFHQRISRKYDILVEGHAKYTSNILTNRAECQLKVAWPWMLLLLIEAKKCEHFICTQFSLQVNFKKVRKFDL